MKPYDLKNKVVVVTGASVGLGKATAISFAGEGAKVALLSRGLEKLIQTRDEIQKKGGQAEVFPIDLYQTEKILPTIESVQKKFGPVDVLINNAGYAVMGLVEDCPIEQYRKNFEVNFFAVIALIQAVLPDMKMKKAGQIINISSGVGRRALPGVSSYCATKFALNGLTESLRLEVKKFGIDVIAIFPGRVDTEFHDRIESYGQHNRQMPEIQKRSAAVIAQLILNASKRRVREASVFGPARIGYHMNYWAPSLVDRILDRQFPT